MTKEQKRVQEINARLDELEDLGRERELTDVEKRELASLKNEATLLVTRCALKAMPRENENVYAKADSLVRENVNRKASTTFVFQRDIQGSDSLTDTGIIPIHEQDLLKPIRLGLIYDKVGLNIQSGLSGTLRWPKHAQAVAQWADEKEALVDANIDFSKLEVAPSRLGIAIPVTKEALDNSKGIVESVIKEEIPASIIDVINDALFNPTATYEASDGSTATHKVTGPFYNLASAYTVTFAGSTPTRAELLSMIATVANNVKIANGCWVMTESMRYALADVKVDEGSGRFLYENGNILGYPVFTTNAIGTGNIGFGDWSYQAAGFFNQMTLIADPYTLARKNSVDFVLNAHFATVTLRDGAFVLGSITSSSSESTDE